MNGNKFLERQIMNNFTDFTSDKEKMYDFDRLTKQEFLDSYSYLTELEYNLTRIKQKEQNES